MKINTTSFDEIWAECFSQYRLLGPLMKDIMRNSAAIRLEARGVMEIGSSDTNHELFSMWKNANNDWQKAALIEVDNF